MGRGIALRRGVGEADASVPGYEVLVRLLRSWGLDDGIAGEILSMCSAPGRTIGAGALDNVVTVFQSAKNGAAALTESSTIELQLAYELERDPEVLAYFNQVACRGVERSINGRRHLSTVTVDFLVVRQDTLTLVECKSQQQLEKLCSSKPDEWHFREGMALHLPMVNWARERALKYETWSPRFFDSVWLSNHELMYGTARGDVGPNVTPYTVDRIEAALEVRPQTVLELLDSIEHLKIEQIAYLLWIGKIHGPERRIEITRIERFHVFREREAAAAHEREIEQVALDDTAQIASWVSAISHTDYQRARERSKALAEAGSSGRKLNRYERMLREKVKDAQRDGVGGVQALATNFHRSGNRTRRLAVEQIEVLERVVKKDWEGGAVTTISTLHSRVCEALKALGLPLVSRTTVVRVAQKTKETTRALNTGGMRNYHSVKAASDPRVRTVAPQASFGVVQIDSTLVDQVVHFDDEASSGKPTLYLAVDVSTRHYIGIAQGPGQSGRYAIGCLLRDIVRRHGRLPMRLMVDRGPDLMSHFLRDFGDRYGVSISYAPTGAAQSKPHVESAYNRANNYIFNGSPGSTLNDKKGRSVDSQFKGKATASLQLAQQNEIVTKILLEEIPRIVDDQGSSPKERFEDELRPKVGTTLSIDDEFLFWTSVPSSSQKIDLRRGLCLASGNYTSDELLSAARRSQFIEARLDCEDPALAWVRTTRGFVKAWSRDVHVTAGMNPIEKKMMHLQRRSEKSAQRKRAPEIKNKVRESVRRENARAEAANAHAVTAPTAVEDRKEESSSNKRTKSHGRIKVDFDDIARI